MDRKKLGKLSAVWIIIFLISFLSIGELGLNTNYAFTKNVLATV